VTLPALFFLQSFHNVDAAADIWNHVNPQFWQYVLPGCDALGYIGCTGTNVCIRARCLAVVSHHAVCLVCRYGGKG
jgi:hypothetical protein